MSHGHHRERGAGPLIDKRRSTRRWRRSTSWAPVSCGTATEGDVRTGAFPSAYPFQELSNVVMSPHRGNDVQGWPLVAARDVMTTLELLMAGEERNLVDLESGY